MSYPRAVTTPCPRCKAPIEHALAYEPDVRFSTYKFPGYYYVDELGTCPNGCEFTADEKRQLEHDAEDRAVNLEPRDLP